MGNAMDFLNNKEKIDNKKKKALKKQPIKKTVITQCPEAGIIDVTTEKLSATHSGLVCTSIPKISARMKAKRKSHPCNCCGELFKSNARPLPSGKYAYSKYCDGCSGLTHQNKRKLVKQMGGYDEYLKYKERKRTECLEYSIETIEEAEERIAFAKKYRFPHKKLDNQLKILTDKKKKRNTSNTRNEEDFDF